MSQASAWHTVTLDGEALPGLWTARGVHDTRGRREIVLTGHVFTVDQFAAWARRDVEPGSVHRIGHPLAALLGMAKQRVQVLERAYDFATPGALGITLRCAPTEGT